MDNCPKKKVEAYKERILDINPSCTVDTFDIFYDESNKDVIFMSLSPTMRQLLLWMENRIKLDN